MTIYGTTDGRVVGQPISPSFGAQNGASAAGAGLIELPAGMPLLVAMSLGLVPINALVTSINGQSMAGGGIGGDVCTVAEMISTGNGACAMRGTPPPPSGGINDQVFAGNQSAVAMLQNGPTPVNTEAQPLGPVSAAITCNNVALTANGFGG